MEELFDRTDRPQHQLQDDRRPYRDEEEDEIDAAIAGSEDRRHELMPLYSDDIDLDAEPLGREPR